MFCWGGYLENNRSTKRAVELYTDMWAVFMGWYGLQMPIGRRKTHILYS